MEWWANVSLREWLWTAHGEAGLTLALLPQASVLVIQFSEEFHSVLLLYFYILRLLWDVGQVHVARVGLVGSPSLSVSRAERGSSRLAADVPPTEPSHEPSYFILPFY